jgi:hypothetical protein
MSVATGLHWFNPIAWIVFRRMRIERELACDAIVLEFTGPSESKAYGQTLLKMLDGLRFERIHPAAIGMLEEKESAQSRIAQIAAFTPNAKSFWVLRLFLLSALAPIGLTDATEKNTTDGRNVRVHFAITNAAIPARTRSSTMRKIRTSKFDKIVLPEFGVPEALPLQKVLGRLCAAVIEADPEHVGVAFMIRSRTSIGHPLLDNYLIRIDPPLKNATLAEICAAISSQEAAAAKSSVTGISYACEKDSITFFEADPSIINVSVTGTNLTFAAEPLAARINPGPQPLLPGVYQSLPYSGYIIVPNSNIDSSMIIKPNPGYVENMPILRPNPELELLPHLNLDSQPLLQWSK